MSSIRMSSSKTNVRSATMSSFTPASSSEPMDLGIVKDDRPVHKFPQIGTVVIGDDVEIGANTCVDRGALGETSIGEGTKIDNLVQVGHNVQIGKRCVIAAQTGISGSTVIEDDCVIGGQVGFGDHARVQERRDHWFAGRRASRKDRATRRLVGHADPAARRIQASERSRQKHRKIEGGRQEIESQT